MVPQESGDSRRAVKDILGASKSLKKTLSQMRDRHPDFPKIGVRVTETADSTGTSVARLVIIIQADTAEHAQEHARDLENEGCSCEDSGETEVTCDCSNE